MECRARSGAQESPEEPPGAYGEEGLATMANWIPSQQGRKLVCEMCKHLNATDSSPRGYADRVYT